MWEVDGYEIRITSRNSDGFVCFKGEPLYTLHEAEFYITPGTLFDIEIYDTTTNPNLYFVVLNECYSPYQYHNKYVKIVDDNLLFPNDDVTIELGLIRFVKQPAFEYHAGPPNQSLQYAHAQLNGLTGVGLKIKLVLHLICLEPI